MVVGKETRSHLRLHLHHPASARSKRSIFPIWIRTFSFGEPGKMGEHKVEIQLKTKVRSNKRRGKLTNTV